MSCVEVEHMYKTIRGRTVLSDITFSIDSGGVYGFFGANGSGKSVLFRCVLGIMRHTSGSVRVFNQEIGVGCSFPPDVGMVIGSGFWDDLTGFENLSLLSRVRRIAGPDDIRGAIARMGLDPDNPRPYRTYSMGMRQRLELAQAIMERPRLLVLDEPTNALDSSGLRMVIDLIQQQRDQGTTIMVCAHNVDEIRRICNRSFAMNDGVLVEAVR